MRPMSSTVRAICTMLPKTPCSIAKRGSIRVDLSLVSWLAWFVILLQAHSCDFICCCFDSARRCTAVLPAVILYGPGNPSAFCCTLAIVCTVTDVGLLLSPGTRHLLLLGDAADAVLLLWLLLGCCCCCCCFCCCCLCDAAAACVMLIV